MPRGILLHRDVHGPPNDRNDCPAPAPSREQATQLGPTRGHDGIFLGYGATMRWFEGHDLAVAVLANSDGAARALPAAAVALAKVALAQPGEGGGRE